MAIYVRGVDAPRAFVQRVLKEVGAGQDATGSRIDTWAVDSNNRLYHTASDWSTKGSFVVDVDAENDVRFLMKDIKDGAFPYLQGRLVELILRHFFDKSYTLILTDARTTQ